MFFLTLLPMTVVRITMTCYVFDSLLLRCRVDDILPLVTISSFHVVHGWCLLRYHFFHLLPPNFIVPQLLTTTVVYVKTGIEIAISLQIKQNMVTSLSWPTDLPTKYSPVIYFHRESILQHKVVELMLMCPTSAVIPQSFRAHQGR